MFKIQFCGIGRAKWNGEIEVDDETLEEAENVALFECRRHLVSSLISLVYIDNLVYDVLAGLYTVGRVKITSI